MYKIFTINANGKIELTKEELEKVLNEAYEQGKTDGKVWVYSTPTTISPYYTLTTCDSTSATISTTNIDTGDNQ